MISWSRWESSVRKPFIKPGDLVSSSSTMSFMYDKPHGLEVLLLNYTELGLVVATIDIVVTPDTSEWSRLWALIVAPSGLGWAQFERLQVLDV